MSIDTVMLAANELRAHLHTRPCSARARRELLRILDGVADLIGHTQQAAGEAERLIG